MTFSYGRWSANHRAWRFEGIAFVLLTVIRFSFRYRSSQAAHILVAFELPESRVLIWREGTQRIIEPVANHPRDLRELLAQ